MHKEHFTSIFFIFVSEINCFIIDYNQKNPLIFTFTLEYSTTYSKGDFQEEIQASNLKYNHNENKIN